MPGGDEITELRALQERAYGRAGSLTPADAARLRQLEFEVEEEAPAVPGTDTVIETDGVDDADPSGGERTVAVAAGSAGTAPPAASVLRARWRLLAGVLLVALLIGVLLGWALFSPRSPQEVPLDAAQLSWQDELLASGKYDPGSVRAIGEEDGTIVWFATRDDGKTVCAIIGDGVTTAPACRGRELALMQGVQTSLRRDVEGGEGRVDAQVQFDAEGDPAVLTSSYLVGADAGGVYATEAEQRAAEQLMDSGYSPSSLMIVGHDGDVPIWIGVDMDSARWCLIYDGSSSPAEAVCDGAGNSVGEGGTLEMTHLDVDAGTSTSIEYRFGPGPSYLEITRGVTDAGS